MKYTLLLLVWSILAACSSDMANRSMYEALENLRRQQCLADVAADCPDRESYNDYTSKRDEVTQ